MAKHAACALVRTCTIQEIMLLFETLAVIALWLAFVSIVDPDGFREARTHARSRASPRNWSTHEEIGDLNVSSLLRRGGIRSRASLWKRTDGHSGNSQIWMRHCFGREPS